MTFQREEGLCFCPPFQGNVIPSPSPPGNMQLYSELFSADVNSLIQKGECYLIPGVTTSSVARRAGGSRHCVVTRRSRERGLFISDNKTSRGQTPKIQERMESFWWWGPSQYNISEQLYFWFSSWRNTSASKHVRLDTRDFHWSCELSDARNMKTFPLQNATRVNILQSVNANRHKLTRGSDIYKPT